MKTIVLVGSGVVSIPPRFGGATELIIHEISKSMPKDTYNVYVLDIKENYNKYSEIIDGAFYVRYKAPKFGNIYLLRLTEFVFGMRAIKKIREMSKKTKIDVVHAHTVFTALPQALFKFLLPEKCRLVYTCHNPAWTAEENNFFNRLIKKIESYVMRKSDYVTTVSDAMRKNIIKETRISARKIRRIYNFVDTKYFSPSARNYWKEKGIEGPVVFFVSKLTPNKGVEYLIRSAALVREKIPEVKYIAAGPPSFEYETENPWIKLVKDLGLEKNVVFTGKMSVENLPKAYASSDVFCFPTLRESFGIVIVEAMSCGLPVVSTDIPVVREITDGKALLVRERDSEQVAEAVIKMLADKKLRSKFSRLSLNRSKHFEKKNIMKQYDRFYRGVTG